MIAHSFLIVNIFLSFETHRQRSPKKTKNLQHPAGDDVDGPKGDVAETPPEWPAARLEENPPVLGSEKDLQPVDEHAAKHGEKCAPEM